ncbi:hypothetical protein TIFTF001_014274 [Ficus carica]|uniref:DNA-directed DNA polymerase n=1 Tax=Ficus carica TaxID=3494 RepID=A0AA88AFR4_FICCA|nr:hypothetical protein TIFTF001_014274 [Ficus carica]
MQRALSSLVRQPLGSQRGFSTISEKIVASVLFERLPVIIPKIDPVVYAFQEFSFRWRQQYRRIYPEELLEKSSSTPFGCHILAEFTIPPALMLRDRNIFLRSTAVTPEIKGSTRAPVLRRGGSDTLTTESSVLSSNYKRNLTGSKGEVSNSDWSPPRISAVQLAAAVTACARIHMYPYISRHDCYYMDTDSVVLAS